MLRCWSQLYQHSTGLLSMWQTKKRSSQCDDVALSLNRPSCCIGLDINAIIFLAAFAALPILPERRKRPVAQGLRFRSDLHWCPTPDFAKPNLQCITTGSLPPTSTSDAMPDPWDSKTVWHSKGGQQKGFVDLFGSQSFFPILLSRSSASSVTLMWRTQIWKVATQSLGLHLV